MVEANITLDVRAMRFVHRARRRPAGDQLLVGTAAAIANATYNATGRRLRELPLTPDKFVG